MSDIRYELTKERVLVDSYGTQYIPNRIYPEVPLSEDDYYVMSQVGDRYDKLSLRFYGTMEYWWIILVANNGKEDSLVLEPGTQVRIPADPLSYINRFRQQNGV